MGDMARVTIAQATQGVGAATPEDERSTTVLT
jgi:hypothetical protein